MVSPRQAAQGQHTGAPPTNIGFRCGVQTPGAGRRPRRQARRPTIRNARDTGLRNLPLHDTAQNQIWLEIVSLALDLLAWMPMLALTGDARRWEPKKLRCGCFPPPRSS